MTDEKTTGEVAMDVCKNFISAGFPRDEAFELTKIVVKAGVDRAAQEEATRNIIDSIPGLFG